MIKQIKNIEKRFQSLFFRYRIGLETSMKGTEFIFDCVQLLYYKDSKMNPNHTGSYIYCPEWIKNQKATINPVNKKDNKCCQSAITVALNHEEIRKTS